MPLISVQDVHKRVRDGDSTLEILRGVSFDVEQGRTVALTGPSGSGKSSLLNILGALDGDFDGSAQVDGRALRAMSADQRARFRNETIGFVFQAYNLLGHLDVLDNIALPARFSPERPSRARAAALAERVGLGDKGHRLPATLSGGERQRVAIARALYREPKLLLCDEPTGNLDRATGEEVLALFAELAQSGVTLLIATHDEEVAGRADGRLRLRRGELQ